MIRVNEEAVYQNSGLAIRWPSNLIPNLLAPPIKNLIWQFGCWRNGRRCNVVRLAHHQTGKQQDGDKKQGRVHGLHCQQFFLPTTRFCPHKIILAA
mmetsp:Transcript_16955/g.23325  ORF Transcript_16955/g.23325 Transcript_16955/m.23325 type:complete len:96 (-) Transcript_16955:26-313(-)